MTTTLVATPDPTERRVVPLLLDGASSTWSSGAAAGAAVLVTITGVPPRA